MDLPQRTADDNEFFARSHCDPGVVDRIIMERAVIRHACSAFLNHHDSIFLRAHNGEDWACEHTRGMDVLMGSIMQTDEEYIYVYKRTGVNAKRGFPYTKIGWMFLVYGNAGYEVINNHTLTLSDLLKPTDAYIDALSLL
jgi:hypothetical protein